jgi:hypothetical protein
LPDHPERVKQELIIDMEKRTSRQRVQQLLAFEEPDRIALTDAYWEDALARWQREGLPSDISPTDYFDFDFDWVYMDASLRLPEALLEETNEYTVRRDKHGFVAKQWKGRAGALGYQEYAVNNRADWERLQNRLTVDAHDATSRIHTVSYFEPFVTYPTWQKWRNGLGDTSARTLHSTGRLWSPRSQLAQTRL